MRFERAASTIIWEGRSLSYGEATVVHCLLVANRMVTVAGVATVRRPVIVIASPGEIPGAWIAMAHNPHPRFGPIQPVA
jgi:hypothetical protein